MKKWIYSAAVGLTVLGLSGCGGTGNSGSSESTAAESVQTESAADVQIPNPMREAEGAGELAEIGVSMEAPEGAADVQYYIISDVVGQVSFTLEGHACTYRGSATAEDFSGIFEEFEQTETIFDADGTANGIRVRTTVSGGRLADWSTAEAKYTLYTPDPVSDEEMGALCLELADASVSAEG